MREEELKSYLGRWVETRYMPPKLPRLYQTRATVDLDFVLLGEPYEDTSITTAVRYCLEAVCVLSDTCVIPVVLSFGKSKATFLWELARSQEYQHRAITLDAYVKKASKIAGTGYRVQNAHSRFTRCE